LTQTGDEGGGKQVKNAPWFADGLEPSYDSVVHTSPTENVGLVRSQYLV